MDRYWAVSSGRRNGSRLEVVMTNDTRASGRSTRRKLSSPGRPRAALRSGQITFWQRIKQGVSSEEACMQAGASAPVGSRWFRQAGGMPPSKFANASASLSAFKFAPPFVTQSPQSGRPDRAVLSGGFACGTVTFLSGACSGRGDMRCNRSQRSRSGT